MPRELHITREGNRTRLELRSPAGQRAGMAAVVPTAELVAALRSPVAAQIDGRTPAGRARRRVTVNRADGEFDDGRLYLWIWNGSNRRRGWDFLGDRAAVLAQVTGVAG